MVSDRPWTLRSMLVDNAGYSLIEVMIAMGLFAIGSLAVVNMQLSSINTITGAKMTTLDISRIADQIETLKSLSYTDPLLDAGTHGTTNGQISWTVVWNKTPNPDFKTITVSSINNNPRANNDSIQFMISM